MRRIAFLLILFSVFSVGVIGQVKISIADISKIRFSDGGGGMGEYGSTDYEIVHENGRWVSYQTGKHRESLNPKVGISDSIQHQLIKTIADDSIRSFLKTLQVISPEYNPAKLGYTVESITKHINERFFPDNIAKAKAFDVYFNTPDKMYAILKEVQHESMTDVGFYCSIYIIKKGGDTVKIISNQQPALGLPWEVNNAKTYDANISRFFAYATGIDGRLGDSGLIGSFYSLVNYRHGKEAFDFSFWMKSEPGNMKYLQKYYTITDISSIGSGSTFNCKLLYRNYHIVINSSVDISNKKQLDRLVKFATDTLQPLADNHTFMIDSCMRSGTCKVYFDYGLDHSVNYSPTIWFHPEATERLKKIYKTGLYRFSVVDRNNTEEDEWLALPDGNFLLASYFRDIVTGVSSAYIKRDGNQDQNVALKVFSNDGKFLRELGVYQ